MKRQPVFLKFVMNGRHVSTPSMMGMGNQSPASPDVVDFDTMMSPMNLDSLKQNQQQNLENGKKSPLEGESGDAPSDAISVSVNGKSRVD